MDISGVYEGIFLGIRFREKRGGVFQQTLRVVD